MPLCLFYRRPGSSQNFEEHGIAKEPITHTWKDCEEMWSEELFNSLNAQLFKLGITPLITLIQIAWAASAACDFLALRLCLFSASQHWWFDPKALAQVRQNDLRLSAEVKLRHGAAAWGGSVPCPAARSLSLHDERIKFCGNRDSWLFQSIACVSLDAALRLQQLTIRDDSSKAKQGHRAWPCFGYSTDWRKFFFFGVWNSFNLPKCSFFTISTCLWPGVPIGVLDSA